MKLEADKEDLLESVDSFPPGASIPHADSTIDGRHVERYEWGA